MDRLEFDVWWLPRMLSIMRIAVGFLFMEHGGSEAVQLSAGPAATATPAPIDGTGRHSRMLRWVSSVNWRFHSARQFHSCGRDGCSLLPRARPTRVLANAQQGRVSRRLLFCVPVLGGSRKRRVERKKNVALDSRFRIIALPLQRQLQDRRLRVGRARLGHKPL